MDVLHAFSSFKPLPENAALQSHVLRALQDVQSWYCGLLTAGHNCKISAAVRQLILSGSRTIQWAISGVACLCMTSLCVCLEHACSVSGASIHRCYQSAAWEKQIVAPLLHRPALANLGKAAVSRYATRVYARETGPELVRIDPDGPGGLDGTTEEAFGPLVCANCVTENLHLHAR